LMKTEKLILSLREAGATVGFCVLSQ